MLICPLQHPLGTFDSLFMYWPSNSGNENVIFLLGKTKNKSTQKIIASRVLVSKDYGKTFTDETPRSSSRIAPPLIDQIYCSKVDPKLVSTLLITYSCACSFEILLSDVIKLNVSLSFCYWHDAHVFI